VPEKIVWNLINLPTYEFFESSVVESGGKDWHEGVNNEPMHYSEIYQFLIHNK
jgi:hypothetical protein